MGNTNLMPHSIEAENATLGGMMLDKEIAYEVLEYVTQDDFYIEANKEIFIAIKELLDARVGADLLTVCERLKQKGSLEMAGGRSYVANLTANVPTVINTVEYAKVVSKKAVSRRLIKAADKASYLAHKEEADVYDLLDDAEKEILSIAQSGQKNNYHMISDVMLGTINKIDDAVKHGGEISGLSTGFNSLDNVLNGLPKSGYIVVAARPSMGKTAFGVNIAANVVKQGKSVLMFSLEMDKEMLGMRLIASQARVDASKLQRGDLSSNDWENINIALDDLTNNKKFAIDDTPGISMMEIRNKCRRFKRENGLDLVVIDYIGLMQTKEKSDNRQDEVRRLSLSIKQLARELECPVIVLCQLRRFTEQGKVKKPTISDLRESGAIEQDADIIMLLHRDEYYTGAESEKPGICEVIVGKNRNGPTGTVELAWVSRYTRFFDKAF